MNKLGIMQPYFFPYVGYFTLIKNCDEFIFFDTPQYIRKGWINRNRIVSNKGDIIYFTVPVKKCERETVIRDVLISHDANWKEKIYGQLSVYKKKAPYYNEVLELVSEVIEPECNNISNLAIRSVLACSDYIGIKQKFKVFSEMGMDYIEVDEPDEWALKITKELGYDTYLNPPGGKSFFKIEKYTQEGIGLKFVEPELTPYRQLHNGFKEGLSIIDMLMFCSPYEISEKYLSCEID